MFNKNSFMSLFFHTLSFFSLLQCMNENRIIKSDDQYLDKKPILIQGRLPIIPQLRNAQRLPLFLERLSLSSEKNIVQDKKIAWNTMLNRVAQVAGSFLVVLPDRKYVLFPLHLVVKKNMIDCVPLLYERGAIQARDFKQWYPIHYITRLPEEKACPMLLALVKDIHDIALTTAFNETVEGMAKEAKMEKLTSLISRIKKSFPYVLHAAVKEGNLIETRSLLSWGINKYQKDNDGFCPMHYISSLDNQEHACSFLCVLIKSNNDAMLETTDGKTLSLLLKENNRNEVIKLLSNLLHSF